MRTNDLENGVLVYCRLARYAGVDMRDLDDAVARVKLYKSTDFWSTYSLSFLLSHDLARGDATLESVARYFLEAVGRSNEDALRIARIQLGIDKQPNANKIAGGKTQSI
jgi:hypothetical protein